jgi:SPP1 gp7 family putative phage head morphogenesis protein
MAAGELFDIDKLVADAIAAIWAGELKAGDVDTALFVETAKALWDAIESGWGSTLASQNLELGDEAAMLAMRENIYVFACFKSYQQVGEMVAALTDSSGNYVSFDVFEASAKALGEKYNRTYLEAEWATAQASGQSAAQWQDVLRNSNVAPMLEYRAVKDDRVRESHRALHGTRLPIDDPFWDDFYPPNGWRCRCDVIATKGKPKQPAMLPTEKEVPGIFRNNPGKSKRVFTKEHPYYEVPKSEIPGILKTAQDEIDKLDKQ